MKGLIMLLSSIGIAFSAFANCEREAAFAVKKKGFTKVSLFWTEVRTNGSESMEPIGYTFWFRTLQCPRGYVIADTDDQCRIQQIYTSNCQH